MTREEAINILRETHDNALFSVRTALETLAPELKESEDKRVRTRLYEYFQKFLKEHEDCYKYGGYVRWEGLDIKSILAYLEKQKYDRIQPVYDNLDSFESALAKAWKEYNDSGSRTVDGCEDDYIECAHAKGFREGYLFGFGKQKEHIPVEWEDYKDKIDIPYCSSEKEQKPELYYDKELDNAAREFYLSGGAKSPVDSTGLVPMVKMAEFGATWMKERMEKEKKPVNNPKWTELTWEDINYLEDLMNKVHYEFRNGIGAESFGKEVLEKFREYKDDDSMDGQKPAEWSEEDETRLTNILIMLKEYAIHHYSKDDVNKSVDWLENRLKCLRPQAHWKPSEEQMKWLKDVIETVPMTCRQQVPLESLYNDLLKLT